MFHPYLVRLWNYVVQVVWALQSGLLLQAEPLGVENHLALRPTHRLARPLRAILTFLIAVPLGIFQATRRNTVFDYAATGTAFVLYAIPSFLLCLLVLQFFSFGISHLPASPPSGVAPWAIFTDPIGFILPVGASRCSASRA